MGQLLGLRELLGLTPSSAPPSCWEDTRWGLAFPVRYNSLPLEDDPNSEVPVKWLYDPLCGWIPLQNFHTLLIPFSFPLIQNL